MSELEPQWYIRKAGVVHGPASLEDLRRLLQAQQITLKEEAGSSEGGPWQPLGNYPEFAPVRPISELFAAPPLSPAPPVPLSASPTAARLLASVLNPGTLSPQARTEFEQGLSAEVQKSIDNKAIPSSLVAGGLTLILVAGLNMVAALVAALVVTGMVYKVVKEVLEHKHLHPISDMSDEMLVTRYNEAKADRRAARTRTAIEWAVIIVVGVLLLIVWAAARSRG